MKIERKWAMPSMHTFTIKPIGELLSRYIPAGGSNWIDPFSGENSPAELTNDHNPEKPTKYHLEAVDFVNQLEGKYDGALFDPPLFIQASIRALSSHWQESHAIRYQYELLQSGVESIS